VNRVSLREIYKTIFVPSPLFNGFGLNRDPRDLREFLLHAVFERSGDIVDLRDRQAAIHRAMAGSQNFVFHLADVHFVAIHELVKFAAAGY